jgi:hypothetical protein
MGKLIHSSEQLPAFRHPPRARTILPPLYWLFRHYRHLPEKVCRYRLANLPKRGTYSLVCGADLAICGKPTITGSSYCLQHAPYLPGCRYRYQFHPRVIIQCRLPLLTENYCALHQVSARLCITSGK